MFDFLRSLFKSKPSQREQNQQDMLQADFQRRVVERLKEQTARERLNKREREAIISKYRDNRQVTGDRSCDSSSDSSSSSDSCSGSGD